MVRCAWFLILGSIIREFSCYSLPSVYIFQLCKKLTKHKGRPAHPFLKGLDVYFEVKSDHMGSPGGTVIKNPPAVQEICRRCRFNPWVGKVPWRRKWQPAPVFLPGKSHGQRSLAGYSPWGRTELDTTAVWMTATTIIKELQNRMHLTSASLKEHWSSHCILTSWKCRML